MARSKEQGRKSKGQKRQHSQVKDGTVKNEKGKNLRPGKRSRVLPVISAEDQKSILEEIKTVFEENIGDMQLSHIMFRIKRDNPDLDSSQYEEKLRVACTEEKNQKYKDMDPAELIASLTDGSKIRGFDDLKEYITVGLKGMIKFAKENKVHLILADGDENVTQRLSNEALLDLPVCRFEGLGKLLKEILDFDFLHFMSFKKCEGSPFNDLVKFILAKIPPEEEAIRKKPKMSPEEGQETAESNGEEEKVILSSNLEENNDLDVANSTENIWLPETNIEKEKKEPLDSNGKHEQVVTP